MADDDDMMEMDELGDDEEGEESGGGGNPLMKYLPLIGVMLVVNVILAYFVAQWFFVPDALPEDAEGIEEVMDAEDAPAEAVAGEEGSGYVPPPPDVAVLYTTLETIVVNPKGTEGLRFLSAQVHLGLSDPAVAEHIDTANLKSRIHDVLIRILTNKTIADVDPSRHDLLKDEIKTQLNEFLGPNAVLEVYFNSFVLQ